MRRTNRGFALIAAIILIVVAAAMSAVLVTMVAGSTVSGGMPTSVPVRPCMPRRPE